MSGVEAKEITWQAVLKHLDWQSKGSLQMARNRKRRGRPQARLFDTAIGEQGWGILRVGSLWTAPTRLSRTALGCYQATIRKPRPYPPHLLQLMAERNFLN